MIGSWLQVTCATCGKDFSVQPWRLRGKYPCRYCSMACHREARRGSPLLSERRAEIVRLYTREMLSGEAIAQRLGMQRGGVWHHLKLAGVRARTPAEQAQVSGKGKVVSCPTCGEERWISEHGVRIGRKYCGNECYRSRSQGRSSRFWPKVERGDGCWRWIGALRSNGYGQFSPGVRGEKPLKAHRVAWELTYGPIPTGMMVCHACDNRACVNPKHLFLGTSAENMADMARKGRSTRGERSSSAILSEQDVRAIRSLYASGGVTQAALAGKFGVSPACVFLVLKRENWSHVQD